MRENHGNEMEASGLKSSSAAHGKWAVQYNPSLLAQTLTRVAMLLEVLVNQLRTGDLVDLTPIISNNGTLKDHDCMDYLVEESYIVQDQDIVHEFPVVTCTICNTDYTEEIYGHQLIEPDEVEKEEV